MEAYYAFVKRIIESFDWAGLDYAFTGALAISFYGVPRTTTDVDVIVAIASGADVKAKLSAALRKAGLVVDERKIDTALSSGYNIASFVDNTSPFSIDVIFSEGKLQKRAGRIGGLRTFFQSPEGLVVAKLRMIKATLSDERSAKDKQDVKAVLQFTKVDLAAVERQAKLDKTLEVLYSLEPN